MVNLRGPIVALLTPFDANGEIEWQAFKTYLTALFSWGVRTVIANGTTGEFPSLTLNERQKVVEFVRKNFQGTIINNVSATCVSDVRDLIAGTQGYGDTVLLLPPYYYSACRNNGLSRFFVSALSGTNLPVMLYNFPQHNGNRLGANLIAMLLDQGITVGIKDSSGDIDNAMIYKSHFPEVKIFFGNDAKVLEVLQQGLSGSVTEGANPLPELLIAIQADFQISGNKAQSMQRSLDVWNEFREISGYFEIPLVKAVMGRELQIFRYTFAPIYASPCRRY